MKDKIREILASNGLKVTRSRTSVLEYLLESKAHPSAEMIREHLEKNGESIPMSPVYNILEVFLEKGIIIKVMDDAAGTARYDARVDFHIHIYDCENNSVTDFEDENISNRMKELVEEIRRSGKVPGGARVIIEA